MSVIKRLGRKRVEPYQDYGFFGPDSVTWKVFRYPTSFMVGFQRTVVSEMFETFLLASVSDTGAVKDRPAVRYDRTLQYVATVAFADSETVVKSSNILLNIHSHIRGIEPLSGGYYDANDPEAQLWIHLTQWHSVLLAYETFGPGKLSPEDEDQYWAECRRAAAFQTIDPETVPRNRQEMRAYYARMRPRMAATEATQETVEHLLNASAFLLDGVPKFFRPFAPGAKMLFKTATVATLPRWMRKLGGIQQNAVTDAVAILAMRAMVRTMALMPDAYLLELIRWISPGAAKIVAPIALELAPINLQTVTPSEAWKKAGKLPPAEQYEQHKIKRTQIPPAKAPRDPGVTNLRKLA
ncbi:MAG: DUF2236 domain-containing protein [Pseudomonadales bacterium]|nr:DUF2236 domain-containing protein [Pseudomonadales bacterium]